MIVPVYWIIYVNAEKFYIMCSCDWLLVTNDFYIYCGFVFGFKLNIMGFINVYRKQICFKPFIYVVKSIVHINLKISWVWTFNYYAGVISKQYRYCIIVQYFRQVIYVNKEQQRTQSRTLRDTISYFFPCREIWLLGADDALHIQLSMSTIVLSPATHTGLATSTKCTKIQQIIVSRNFAHLEHFMTMHRCFKTNKCI